MVGGDVYGDWKIDYFHSMACYASTMNNCGKVREGYIGGAGWILPQFQAIKENSVVLTINEMLHECVGKVGGFKISDAVGTPIRICSAYDMVLNPTLDSFVCHHSWRLEFLRREPNTTLSDFSSIFRMQEGHCRENMV